MHRVVTRRAFILGQSPASRSSIRRGLRLVLQWSLPHHFRYRHLVQVRIGVSASWRQNRHIDQNRQGVDLGHDLR